MDWKAEYTDAFEAFLLGLDEEAQVAVMTVVNMLQLKGPSLSRPYADTLKGSRYSNMKELRTRSKRHPYRACFAFDPTRSAILLCGGREDGAGDKQFYSRLIALADSEYEAHLARLNAH